MAESAPRRPNSGPLIEDHRPRAMEAIDVVRAPAYDPLRTSSAYPEADADHPTSVVGHQRAFLLAMRPSRSSAL